MIMDRRGYHHRPFSGGDIRGKVNDYLKGSLWREVLDRIDNVTFCRGVEFFFMEWCRIERIEELCDRREFDLDQDPAVLFFIQ